MTSLNMCAELGDPCRSSTAGLDACPPVMNDSSVPPDRRSRCRVATRMGGPHCNSCNRDVEAVALLPRLERRGSLVADYQYAVERCGPVASRDLSEEARRHRPKRSERRLVEVGPSCRVARCPAGERPRL